MSVVASTRRVGAAKIRLARWPMTLSAEQEQQIAASRD
jgi:hypothetical protein